MNQNNNIKPKKASFRLDKTNIIILVFFVILSIFSAFIVFRLAKNIISTWTMTNLEGLPVTTQGTKAAPNNNEDSDPLTDIAIDPMEIEMPAPLDVVSHVTIILMALDYRD